MTRGPGDLDAAGAVRAVSAGHLRPTDLLTDARGRIARWEPWLGAVVAGISPAAGGGRGPLGGAVVGVKDLFAVAGQPRQCGGAELVGADPQPEHATAVARLVGAGARIVARLALHQLAFGVITPQTRNPRAPDRVAGGSSGGSAAALAAGLIHASVGSDSGGSIRIPAACCGVVGLKTTRGLVPLTGVQPLARSLDTAGPLATTVDDLALVLDVIAGHDPADPYSDPSPPPSGPVPRRKQLRVGVPGQIREARMDPDVRSVWEATLDDLSRAGVTIVPVALPSAAGAQVANGRILAAEAAAVHLDLLEHRGARIQADVRARLEHGRDLRAHVVAGSRHHGAVLRADLRRLFAEVDVLVTPTLPCRVPPLGADEVEVDGEAEGVTFALTRFTNLWNLAGVPAGSVPAGTDLDGAPVGVQVVGRWFDEPVVLSAMRAIEDLRGGPWPTVRTRPAA